MPRNRRIPSLDREDLRALIDHLEHHLTLEGCDQTLRVSRTFLASRGVNVAQAVCWLKAQGPLCDCEVRMNL